MPVECRECRQEAPFNIRTRAWRASVKVLSIQKYRGWNFDASASHPSSVSLRSGRVRCPKSSSMLCLACFACPSSAISDGLGEEDGE